MPELSKAFEEPVANREYHRLARSPGVCVLLAAARGRYHPPGKTDLSTIFRLWEEIIVTRKIYVNQLCIVMHSNAI